MFDQKQIISILGNDANKLKLQEMGIKHLSLVGSFSRNEQKSGSDVDLVYEKSDPKNFDLFDRFDVKDYLETLINLNVDLISPKYINPYIKKSLLSSLIKIF